MHRDASLWHRPLTFDPDRWRDIKPDKPLGSLDLLQGLGHNGSYLPFGAAFLAIVNLPVLHVYLTRHDEPRQA